MSNTNIMQKLDIKVEQPGIMTKKAIPDESRYDWRYPCELQALRKLTLTGVRMSSRFPGVRHLCRFWKFPPAVVLLEKRRFSTVKPATMLADR